MEAVLLGEVLGPVMRELKKRQRENRARCGEHGELGTSCNFGNEANSDSFEHGSGDDRGGRGKSGKMVHICAGW